jgi:hypothetical protein
MTALNRTPFENRTSVILRFGLRCVRTYRKYAYARASAQSLG